MTTSDDKRKLDRRTFLVSAGLALGSGAVTLRAEASRGDHHVPLEKDLSPDWVKNLFEGGRQAYMGAALETIGMPCGGIGAGQLYVRGDGTLAHWWIANNAHNTGYGIYDTVTTPVGIYRQAYSTYRPFSPVEQGFAIRVEPEDGPPQTRELSSADFDDIRFFGEYPVATVEYESRNKPDAPAAVTLQVFSPFIPLNTRDSSLPLTVLRFSVRNTAGVSQDVSLAGWLQNAVFADLRGRIAAKSRNRVQRTEDMTSVRMDVVEASDDTLITRRTTVFEDFEDGWNSRWRASGEAFGSGPVTRGESGFEGVSGFDGNRFVSSGHGGDEATGRLVSQPFRITEPYIAFLVGGKSLPGETGLNLVVEGEVVRTSVGASRDTLETRYWDVRDLAGKEARLEIVDRSIGARGRIHLDQIFFTNLPPLATETFSRDHPQYGEMVLSVLDPEAWAAASWTSKGDLLEMLKDGNEPARPTEATARLEDPLCGSVMSRFRLRPGEEREAVFLVSWHFPNRRQDNSPGGWGKTCGGLRPVGNRYANDFSSGLEVARYAAQSFDRLHRETILFRDTYYDTSLP